MKQVRNLLEARENYLLQLKKEKESSIKKFRASYPEVIAEEIYEELHKERQN